jgi:hypothetical protein
VPKLWAKYFHFGTQVRYSWSGRSSLRAVYGAYTSFAMKKDFMASRLWFQKLVWNWQVCVRQTEFQARRESLAEHIDAWLQNYALSGGQSVFQIVDFYGSHSSDNLFQESRKKSSRQWIEWISGRVNSHIQSLREPFETGFRDTCRCPILLKDPTHRSIPLVEFFDEFQDLETLDVPIAVCRSVDDPELQLIAHVFRCNCRDRG